MSLIEYTDSLPYIDTAPTPAERNEIDRLITAELAATTGATPDNQQQTQQLPHQHLPPIAFHPSDLMQKELDRVAAGQPISGNGNGTVGIDMARYESAPEAPGSGDGGGDVNVNDWRAAVRRAYAASAYLAGRRQNLELLDAHGRNAWLVANAQAEEMLRRVEGELRATREAGEAVNRARKGWQTERKGELLGLDEAWRKGLRGTHEVQVAAENVRQEILARRRELARA